VKLTIGKEYRYLDRPVRLLDLAGDWQHAEAVIQTRFGERTVVPASELKEKQ